jgi:hypothetical protein
LGFCPKHLEVMKARIVRAQAKESARRTRVEAAWRAKKVPLLPQMRVQLERAQAELERRTASAVDDRAAYGGATHRAVTRTQGRILSDSNVTRVLELQRLIERLTADISRAEREVA